MSTPCPTDLAADARETAEAIQAVAALCIPRTTSHMETPRELTVDRIGPVFDILARGLLAQLDALDRSLSA